MENIFYNSQFVQGEIAETLVTTIHKLKNPPISGTITGEIHENNNKIQTFWFNVANLANFNDIKQPKNKVISGEIINNNLIFTWNYPPEICKISVNYEYDIQETKHLQAEKSVTFNKFLSLEELETIGNNAGTVGCWDFNSSLGDTVKEKFESLYFRIVELTNVLIKKGAKGLFWICTSPEITSIFETCTAGFNPAPYQFDIVPLGMSEIIYQGTISRKWRLYCCEKMFDTIIIGCNDKLEDFKHYGKLKISNLAI